MADRADGVTQTEISTGVGRSIHEVYRIIQLLERRGYLVRAPRSDRYRLSLKLFELAHKHPPVNRLIDVALPVMRALAAGSDQSCHLAVLRDLQILDRAAGRFAVADALFGGARLALPDPRDEFRRRPARQPPAERARAADRAHRRRRRGRRRRTSPPASPRSSRIGFEMRPSLAVEGCINISLPDPRSYRHHRGGAHRSLSAAERMRASTAERSSKQAQAATLEISQQPRRLRGRCRLTAS